MTVHDNNLKPTSYELITQTLRPNQWIKSSFILAPALFTLAIVDSTHWISLLIGFFGFSLTASAIYAFNDICNRHEDRLHPVKTNRPVASGSLSVRNAAFLSTGCLLIGMTLLLMLGQVVALVGLIYVILMIAYSLYLRNLVIVDVIIIATGFVLRVLIGAIIIGEPLSHWLVLCTFTIALFLGMIKRRQELVGVYPPVLQDSTSSFEHDSGQPAENQTRSVLAKYPSIRIIDGWINVLSGMTILCYALYTVDPHTIEKHHTGALIYTLPLVIYGVFRYQQVSSISGEGEDPAGLVAKDFRLRLCVLFWV
ncbi:MAG: UbiA prenyltransferase family protein, partial [Calditrichaeota bacterium]|nr:UbiA prenyltransferase family protein [Calditrichota bacterium]